MVARTGRLTANFVKTGTPTTEADGLPGYKVHRNIMAALVQVTAQAHATKQQLDNRSGLHHQWTERYGRVR